MLGKEHVLSTLIFAITFVYIAIFQHFYVIKTPLTVQQMMFDLANLPEIDYIYIGLFIVAMLMASTAPDIDVEQPISVVKRRRFLSSLWFTIVKYIAYLPMAFLLSFSKNSNEDIGHRKIFHSLYGAISYTISIIIIFIIILTLFFIVLNYKNTKELNSNTIGSYINQSVMIVKNYWNFVFVFLIGSFLGFMAHLFEDSLTVSGIVYLPFITNIGLKGRLRTGSKEFYELRNVGIFGRSWFGMVMIWVFNIAFIFVYYYYNLYLLSLINVIIIYVVGIFIFLKIFAGLRFSRFNRA